MLPTLGRIVHYRGKLGVRAMRAAIVVVDVASLLPEGDIDPLSSNTHAHLWVFTPSERGGFLELDVAQGERGADGLIPPGTWCWPTRT